MIECKIEREVGEQTEIEMEREKKKERESQNGRLRNIIERRWR